jgi:hypothetical protein
MAIRARKSAADQFAYSEHITLSPNQSRFQ